MCLKLLYIHGSKYNLYTVTRGDPGAYPGIFSGQLLSTQYSVTGSAPIVGGEWRNFFDF